MNEIILISASILAPVSTRFINIKLKLGPVIASALLSLIVAIFFKIFPDLLNEYLTKTIPIVFIGASFIGMSSSQIISCYKQSFFSGFVFVFIFLYSGSFFKGYGGGLGATACLSVVITMGIEHIFSKLRKNSEGAI